LRMGYLEIVLHEPEKAIEHFARARETDDVFIGYLARFLSGRAADMLDRRDDATAMYRSALELLPGTQSAATALAANLFLAGQPEEAYALADQALSPGSPQEDPWQLFGYGDRRLIPERIASLREALK
jgi:tetratricopeptide (TPR) repeat protein